MPARGSGPRLRLPVLLVAVGLVAAACFGGGSGASPSAGAVPPGQIVIGTTDSLQNSFDPAQAYDAFASSEIIANTAETLVTYAPNAIEPSPLLAATMPTVSSDGLIYSFVLRAGVHFADGTLLDAAAVKFSLLRAQAFGALDPESAGFLLDDIDDIGTPPGGRVVIRLKRPDVTFLSRLSYSVASIVSPKAYTAYQPRPGDTTATVTSRYKADTIVGTGPYRLLSYQEKYSLTFVANPHYWGERPKVGRVLVRLYDSSAALKLALQTGEVDIAYRSLQPDEIANFAAQPGKFTVVKGSGSGIRYLVVNTQSKPWDNPAMRAALAAAIDRQAITTAVFGGTAGVLASMVPPAFPTSTPAWSDLYGPDVIPPARRHPPSGSHGCTTGSAPGVTTPPGTRPPSGTRCTTPSGTRSSTTPGTQGPTTSGSTTSHGSTTGSAPGLRPAPFPIPFQAAARRRTTSTTRPSAGSGTGTTAGGAPAPNRALVNYLLDVAGEHRARVPVELWYSPTHYGSTEADVAELVARSLEASGRFSVKVQSVEWAEFGQKRQNGEMPVFLMGWFPDYLDPDDYLEPFADPKVFDPAKWDDARMLDLVHSEERESDPQLRAQSIRSAQERMAEQAPYIPLFSVPAVAVTSARVRGVVLDPIQTFRFWLLEKTA